MRKWMRERLQRRKKTPAEPSDQPAPPPLQPAYFEAEQPPGPRSDSREDGIGDLRSNSTSAGASTRSPGAAFRLPRTAVPGTAVRRRAVRGATGSLARMLPAVQPAAVAGAAADADEVAADASRRLLKPLLLPQ